MAGPITNHAGARGGERAMKVSAFRVAEDLKSRKTRYKNNITAGNISVPQGL